MSGQAGCYYFDHRPIDRELIGVFDHDLMRHGPDGGSHYSQPGLFMVHRACHFDYLSELEAQPYVSVDGLVITFDGRLDNRNDLLTWLRDTLVGETTDVALIAAAYQRWGEQGFARLIGDWSLSLWDQRTETVLLASDYCGVRPLYYRVQDGTGICWSSSLQSLVDRADSAEVLDESWIAALLTARPKFERTVYRHIRAVPPAHVVRASREGLSVSRFWSLAPQNKILYQDERLYEEHLLHHFREAVAVRLRSNRPVSCDLSGGLDSSSVACMAHELVRSGTVQARRVIGFTELDHCSEDERFARIVKERLGIEHICCDMQSTWSLDPAQITPAPGTRRRRLRAKLLLGHGIRINLTGVPGDLIMGSVLDDCGQVADSLYGWRFGHFLAGAYLWSRALRIPIYQVFLRGVVPLLPPDRQRLAWKRQSIRQGLYANVEQRRSCFTAKVLRQLDESWTGDLEPCRWHEAVPSVRQFLAELEFQNLSRCLETSVDLGPIQDSHPYSHRPLVEYISAIPRNKLCGPGERRRLMRRAFADLLPPEIANRKAKAHMGYQHYIEAQELLQRLPASAVDWEVVKRGWVDSTVLSETLGRIARGTLHDWSEITKILTLETWFGSREAKNSLAAYEAASSNSSLTVNN
jgi:asparagine synthase (glutamine-hydrolysing)